MLDSWHYWTEYSEFRLCWAYFTCPRRSCRYQLPDHPDDHWQSLSPPHKTEYLPEFWLVVGSFLEGELELLSRDFLLLTVNGGYYTGMLPPPGLEDYEDRDDVEGPYQLYDDGDCFECPYDRSIFIRSLSFLSSFRLSCLLSFFPFFILSFRLSFLLACLFACVLACLLCLHICVSSSFRKSWRLSMSSF